MVVYARKLIVQFHLPRWTSDATIRSVIIGILSVILQEIDVFYPTYLPTNAAT